MRSATCEKCKAVFECGSRGRLPQFCKNCKTDGVSTVAVECRHCGKVFGCKNNGKGKFCSRKCVCDFNRGQHKGGRRYKCIECGVGFKPSGGKCKGIYCSPDCCWAHKRRSSEQLKAEKDRAKALRAETRVIDKDRRKAEKLAARKCIECGVVMPPESLGSWARCCSDRCMAARKSRSRKKNRRPGSKKHESRCRRLGLPYVTKMTTRIVYEMDKGICQLCMMPTRESYDAADLMSPTTDHVVPIHHPLNVSHGHTLENVQLAHMGCNSRKSNRVEADVLLVAVNPRESARRLREQHGPMFKGIAPWSVKTKTRRSRQSPVPPLREFLSGFENLGGLPHGPTRSDS